MASRPFPSDVLLRPGWAARRSAGLARPRRLGHPRLVGALVLAILVAAAGWWFGRDCALVAVKEVRITGLTSSQAGSIRTALTTAAAEMTTLHVDQARLRAAVASFPIVAKVTAEGNVPHLLKITVVERPPIAVLKTQGQSVPVAADGTLLRGVDATQAPTVTVKAPPAGPTLKDGLALAQLKILAAAPAPLRAEVTRMFTGARGMQAQLRNGPIVAFGAPDRLAAKWGALVAVLADGSSAGATLIDLTVPESPAAAGLEPIASTQATSTDAIVPDAAAGIGVQTATTATAPATTTTTP
jgi:cell division protein FtsQ